MTRTKQNMAKAHKGVNLGGWLLMEGYILHSRNIPEHCFKSQLKKICGQKELEKFEQLFRDNFITEADFKRIADLGADLIRVPFNHRLLEKRAFFADETGFMYLDRVFAWAEKYQLKVILDLHAACGSQNHDWHSDSNGQARLWEDTVCRKRTYWLWQEIAGRYHQHPNLYAYDVLNEPVLGKKSTNVLKKFYAGLIKHIRQVDKNTLIYLEGALWAQQIDFLADLITDNVAVSIHTYQPLNYVFNFHPFFKYPGNIENTLWNKDRLFQHIEPYFKFAQKHKTRIFAGEFGINWRGGHYGEACWLDDLLEIFDEFKFDYTYWTYKAVANSMFPDGIYQCLPNDRFICREGPVCGWETYPAGWQKRKPEILRLFRTENYTPNKELCRVLSKHFRRT